MGTLRDKREEIVELIERRGVRILGLAETRLKGHGRELYTMTMN